MKLFTSIICCCLPLFINAQKLGPYTISATGQSFETAEVALYVSIGEPLNTMLSDGEISISQGILQIIFEDATPANPPCATNIAGTLFFEECDDGNLYFFVKTDAGEIYDPYYANGVAFEHEEGEVKVDFGFIDADFETPCSIAEKAIIITCIKAAIVSSDKPILFSPETLFEVHPNPSKNAIKVLLNTQNQQNFYLQIFDLQGKEIFHKTNVKQDDLVDISTLAKGIYHLSLTNESQQRKTVKLVKH